MFFNYKAKKIGGEEVTGTREAPDRFTLARELRVDGLIVVSAEETKFGDTGGRSSFSSWWQRVSLKEKILFANNLGSMITAGLTLTRSLGIIEKQSKHKYFKYVVHEVTDRISKGESLAKAMRAFPGVFPSVFTAMVAAGEESGKLPESLKIIGSQLSKSYELRRKIKGAMIYPAIILCLVFAIGVLMLIFVVPTLSATFKEFKLQLPLSTRIVIGFGNILSQHYWLVLLGLIVVVPLIISGLRTKAGLRAIDYMSLRLPLIGTLVKETNSAITMRTMASLITAGVSMIESLQITERVIANTYYQTVLQEAGQTVAKGVPLSTIFKDHEKLYPVFVAEMTEVGEETGNLADMLSRGATFYEEEVDQVTKNLSTVMEPALMIVIGIVVGFFAISILGPLYSLTNAI